MKRLAICLLALTVIGCMKKRPTEPEPDPPGNVEFTVTPGEVFWDGILGPPQGPGSPSCPNPGQGAAWGPLIWRIRETSGGTVIINSFTFLTTADYDGSVQGGGQLMNALTTLLTGTAASTLTLTPNQSLVTREIWSCQRSLAGNGQPAPILELGSRTVFTVNGQDSNGTAVSSTAMLILRPTYDTP